MKRNITILIIIIATSALIGSLYFMLSEEEADISEVQVPETQDQERPMPEEVPQKVISEPISNAKSRITKKPFGIYITPATSPVQPEKFTGYHTGTDFEITQEETNADVPVYAICSGEIIRKEVVDGYGGVIVQSCAIDGQAVTVLYGHLNIRQVQTLGVGTGVKSGDRISSLAQGESDLTDGERKHLHLGMVKGSNIDYRGYVGSQSELSDWLDIENYF